VRCEAGAQGGEVRQATLVQLRRQGRGELGLAAAVVGQRQERDHGAAG
jgi:hypothetical protein